MTRTRQLGILCATAALALVALLAPAGLAGEKNPKGQTEKPKGEKPRDEEPQLAEGQKTWLDGWTYSRVRKTISGSNKVTAQFTLKNVSEANLGGVSVEVTFLSGLGDKVGGPLKQTLGTVRSKETKQVEVSGEFIPAFGGYEIAVKFSGGEETWFSGSDMGMPALKTGQQLESGARVVILGEDVGTDRANRLNGKIRVRNVGKLEANNLKLTVTYYATVAVPRGKKGEPARTKLGEWSGKLGSGKLGPGVEQIIPVAIPQPMPRNAVHYELKVSCDEMPVEQQLAGGEFQNAAELETAHWKFVRAGKKQEDLEVTFDIRNGFKDAVENVAVSIAFQKLEKGEKKAVKKHVEKLPDALKPGEVKTVTFTLASMPAFDAYEQALDFARGGGKQAAGAPKVETSRKAFQNLETVEILMTDFVAGENDAVSIVTQARNGRAHTVKDVAVTVHVFDAKGKEMGTVVKKLDDPIPPGVVRNFIVKVENAKDYARFTSDVAFKEEQPEGGAAP